MSSTTSTIDIKADLISRLETISKSYINDLSFIPADKLNVSPGGSARSPLTFTAECFGFNNMLADGLLGAPIQMPAEEEIAAFYASIDTFEKAKAGFEMSISKLAKTIAGLSEEQLSEPIDAPWGQEMTKLQICNLCISHMAYHDGQLNYIQTLYGDAENHWGEH